MFKMISGALTWDYRFPTWQDLHLRVRVEAVDVHHQGLVLSRVQSCMISVPKDAVRGNEGMHRNRGCIVEPRPPADRHFEHAGKSKTVKNHFIRKKRVFSVSKPGKLPSLARAMAAKGPGCMTMRPLQEFSPSSTLASAANAAEKHWDWVLGPTLNGRAPFGGLHCLNWEVLLNNELDKPETASLKDRVVFMIQGGTEHAALEDLLSLLSLCEKHVHPQLFNNFLDLRADVPAGNGGLSYGDDG